MNAQFKKTRKGKEVSQRLEEMISRSKDIRPFLKRVTYPEYKETQILRWQKYNVNKNFLFGRWKPLNKKYEERKKRKFKSYPYKGRRMGIATGMLLKSVVGEKEGLKFHRSIVRKDGLIVLTELPYAKSFDEVRTISSYSPKYMKEVQRKIMGYVRGGK